jgi:molecular chaperone GrpE
MTDEQTQEAAAPNDAPAAEGVPQTAPAEQPNDLAAQLEAEKKRSAELLDSWQRARAELINYKRRIEQERQREMELAGVYVVQRVLPALDDFDLALANRPTNKEAEAWVNGVALVAHKLRTALESLGVQPITTSGQKFDPALHEAVMAEEGGGEHVVAELRRGYTMNGNVIRPALVKVGKQSAASS